MFENQPTMKIKLFGVLILSFFTTIAFAQKYYSSSQEEFGKSRVQYKRFEWKSIRSNNFEFNYYRGGNELSQTAAKIAESEFDRITEILGYTPFTTMKVFIYNSPKDLAQSNIGLSAPIDYDGSILNLSRSRVEVAYKGNDDEFKSEIVQQVSKLFVYDMLYGGSLKEVLQSSLMLSVPEWYMSGVARYISRNNDSEDELELMKDKIVELQDRKLKSLKGEEAEIVGQSIWNYIARRYGIDNISNILNLTRIIRDEQSSITSTLGISYVRFLGEWQDFYVNGRYNQKTENTLIQTAKAEESNNKKSPKVNDFTLKNMKPSELDTENYQFSTENIKLAQVEVDKSLDATKKQKTLTRLRRVKEELVISEPKAYQNLLITNEVKTEFLNDPVRRIGMRNTLMINDMLENNVFQFGVFVGTSLKNHDIVAAYKNNTKRLDWGIKYERRSIFLERADARNHYLFRPLGVSLPATSEFNIFRRVLFNKIEGLVSYPFSNSLKVNISPFIVNTTDVDFTDLTRKNLDNYYGGARSEIVFDNTTLFGTNMPKGSKAKLSSERYVGLNNSAGFTRLNFDARHYQRLIKGVVLAGRVSYGTSAGNAPKVTFIGGTENWVGRKVQPTIGQAIGVPVDLRDIAFYNFAGNLRGFNFGKMYGNNHLLANVELRVSLADFIANGTVASSSLKNLQLVFFDDIGTAWNGTKGPFSRQNNLNTEIIGGGNNPFRAVVTNFKNPFLMGYGVGLRTTILGYFVRADYAWGLEDKETNKPILHISLGYDF